MAGDLDATFGLVRLRWLAVVGQLILVLLAHYLAIAELRQEWLVVRLAEIGGHGSHQFPDVG